MSTDMIFRCVFDACLSLHDMDIERTPYHRNCNCALHTSKPKCSHSAPQQRIIAFPRKQIRGKCCYSISSSSSQSSHSSSWNTEFINEGFNYKLVQKSKMYKVARNQVFPFFFFFL
ncbi:hypothetical protein ACS0TY_021237 [Phlomoides rotata]